jgi:hypothetical protein
MPLMKQPMDQQFGGNRYGQAARVYKISAFGRVVSQATGEGKTNRANV